MNNFFKGLLVGVGVGLVVAPMRGEEMRRLLAQRIQDARGYLPENGQVNHYVNQVSDRVSQASSDLKGYAQQAAGIVKDSSGNLSDLAQQAASKVKDTGSSLSNVAQQATARTQQAGQDVADTTKQATSSAKRNASAPDTAPFPSAYPTYTNPEKGE
jgi:gas vesicle protein